MSCGPLTAREEIRFILEAFEAAGVAYAVVGDVGFRGDAPTSDIDIVVPQERLANAARVLSETTRSRGLRVVQRIRHEWNATHVVVAGRHDARVRFLNLDICGDLYRDTDLLLRADAILAGRRGPTGEEARPAFTRPAPGPAFLYSLLRRFHKRDLDAGRSAELARLWSADPAAAEAETRTFFGLHAGAVIADAARRGAWASAFEDRSVRDAFHSAVRPTARSRLGEIARTVDRILRPTGLWVAFLGPDGVGKSTIIEAAMRTLSPVFPARRRYHLRPRLGSAASIQPTVVDPHRDPARLLPTSIAKLGYWWLDYVVGYLIRIRPQVTRSTLVAFDRFFDDLLIDPVRYRYGGPLALVRWVARAIPRPELCIVLDAPVDVLRARKAEVDPDEIERQRQRYAAWVASLERGHLVDASRPVEEVVDAVVAIVLDHMEQRTAARSRDRGDID